MKSKTTNIFTACKLAVAVAALSGGMSALADRDIHQGNDSALDQDSSQYEAKVNHDSDNKYNREYDQQRNSQNNYQSSNDSDRAKKQDKYAENESPNTVHFAFDSADLTSEAKNKLDKIKDKMKDGDISDAAITIKGYADATGDRDYNKDLSERRAESVRSYLSINEQKVEDVELEAHGESNPAMDNDTREGRQGNRRVEISVEGVENFDRYTMN